VKQRLIHILASIIGIAFLLSLAAPPGVRAQQKSSPAPQSTPSPIATPSPVSIPPLTEIASGLDDLKRLLQEVKRRLADDSARRDAKRSLEALSTELDTRSKQTDEVLESLPSMAELQDLDSEWTSVERRLTALGNSMVSRSTILNTDIAWLNNQEDRWTKLLHDVQLDPALAELQATISQSLNDVQTTRTFAQEQLKATVTLQTRVSERDQFVVGVLERINTEEAALQRGLFHPDTSPLWQIAARRESDLGLQRVLRTRYARDWVRLREFVSEKRFGLILALLLGLAATVAAFKMQQALPRWTEQGIVPPRYVHTFQRPYALGAFAGLLATFPMMFGAPAVAKGLVSLLLIIPLLRLVGPLISRIDLQLVYILLGTNLLVVIIKIATLSVSWKRNFLALLTLGIAFAAVWLSRQMISSAKSGYGRWIAIFAVRCAAFLMFASFVANLFGYFSLSQVLTEGTLFAAYSAVNFYAARKVSLVITSTLLKTQTANTIAVVREYGARIDRWIAFLLTVTAWIVWIVAILRVFTLRDETYAFLRKVLTKPLGSGETSFTAADIAIFLLVLLIGIVVSSAFRVVLREDVLKRLPLRHGVPFAASTITYYVMLFFVFMLALIAAGVQLSKFTLFTGAFGIGVGFGLQNTINNFASGIVLLLERPIRENDILEVDGAFGEVMRIGMRSTSIRTAQEAEVIVPNSALIAGKVINWSRLGRRRPVEIPVKVAYGTNPQDVIDLLIKTASTHPEALADPSPAAFLQRFGDTALEFVLVFWVGRYYLHRKVLSEVAIKIADAFADADIQIHVPDRAPDGAPAFNELHQARN
jgi:small-conductance mechanosensitive channel